VTPGGTFERGASTLQLPRDPDEPARWADVRRRLLEARDERPQPGRDDKVVAAWNGLAVAALAEAGALLDRPDWVEAALAAADLLVAVHLDDHGRLRRTSRDGRAGDSPGVLEDYGDLAEAMLALHAVTGDPVWLSFADGLLEVVLADFAAPDGTLHDTPVHGTDERVLRLGHPQDPTDNATPSGRSAAAGALLSFSALTGSERHRTAAERALGVAVALAERAPRFVGWGLAVAEALLAGPAEVAVVGADGDPDRARLHRVALAATSPGAVVSVGEPVDAHGVVPLLRDRPLVDGHAAAYVCRGFVCAAPVTEAGDLAALVGARTGL
jgi:uncharacterized protein YyaL (SSP411 family)